MKQPELSGRELDAEVARAIGIDVIAEDWPCGDDGEGGYVAALTREKADVYPELYNERGPVFLDHGCYEPVAFYHRSLDACMSAYAVLREHGWRLATIADIDERICVRLWHEMKAPFEGIGGYGPTAPTAFARAMMEAGKRSTQ